jgi:hypothetical protein
MARDIEKEKQDYLAAILGFDNTEFHFEQGFKLTLHIRQSAPSEDRPHGFAYEFNLFAPDAAGDAVIRILATDNAHAPADAKHPHDHWHAAKMNVAGTRATGVRKGKAVVVHSIEDHIGRFLAAAEKLLALQGVNPLVVAVIKLDQPDEFEP